MARNQWLTLNLGLRYDVFTPKTEVRDRISNLNVATGQVLYPGFNTGRSTGIQTDHATLRRVSALRQASGATSSFAGGYGISFYPGDINSGALLKEPTLHSVAELRSDDTTPCPLTAHSAHWRRECTCRRSTSPQPHWLQV